MRRERKGGDRIRVIDEGPPEFGVPVKIASGMRGIGSVPVVIGSNIRETTSVLEGTGSGMHETPMGRSPSTLWLAWLKMRSLCRLIGGRSKAVELFPLAGN